MSAVATCQTISSRHQGIIRRTGTKKLRGEIERLEVEKEDTKQIGDGGEPQGQGWKLEEGVRDEHTADFMGPKPSIVGVDVESVE